MKAGVVTRSAQRKLLRVAKRRIFQGFEYDNDTR